MARVRPTADVDTWLQSVAEVLPLPHRAPVPYTLGEAVRELGDYAHSLGGAEWTSRSAENYRLSLRGEIHAQFEFVGGRLRTLVEPLLAELCAGSAPEVVSAAAATFRESWHSERAKCAAFDDLCAQARIPGTTTTVLRRLSAIIASQIGEASRDSFSPLRRAADALVDSAEDLVRRHPALLPVPLDEEDRVGMAKDSLMTVPTGDVVVWTAYYRATLPRMRLPLGPMVFLEAEWALPNAFAPDGYEFDESSELRQIRGEVSWLDTVFEHDAASIGNRVVLVRIELGERSLAGAVEEALRRIEAVISLAVEAGGVSWQRTGAQAVLLDGAVRSSSYRVHFEDVPPLDDDAYGIAGTGDVLNGIADQLRDALTRGPMPDPLVEALTVLREARMTDHRDVDFYGARRVTPRVATALEDHAMELLASVIGTSPKKLADTIEIQETLESAGRHVAIALSAPVNSSWQHGRNDERRELERKIVTYNQGRGVVSIAAVVAHQEAIRALPMSALQRADFEDALAVCADPIREKQFLEEEHRETLLLRARHRRVRNAVNHGLPLRDTTLDSIRAYADSTSRSALHLALTWFKNGGSGESLLQRGKGAWIDRMDRINRGMNWAAAEAREAPEKDLGP